MTWNYRVISHRNKSEPWLGIHEVYYDGTNDEDIRSYSSEPVRVLEDDLGAMRKVLTLMLQALDRPVLDERELNKQLGV